ncbi:hypothetical protein [Saccharomonospora iraqiensis]|uniref:hypothetical protein n=1 Tax=Saccharomonospora iraqiensis TaxID=52698 RepID=UPI00022E67B2|nr:hypothetical protein [Saccharomonospora iraqiensis]
MTAFTTPTPFRTISIATAKGTLNFGGGAKDAGGRVADALLYPDSEHGRRIRGS